MTSPLSSSTGATPSWILTRFGVAPIELHALGNHGGFSGARLWRVRTATGDYFVTFTVVVIVAVIAIANVLLIRPLSHDQGRITNA